MLPELQPIKTEMKHQLAWSEQEARLFLQAMYEVDSIGGIAEIEPITMEIMESIQNFVLNRFHRSQPFSRH